MEIVRGGGAEEERRAGPCSVLYGEGVVPIRQLLATLAQPVANGCPVCVEIGQVAPGADELELVEGCVRWLQALPRFCGGG